MKQNISAAEHSASVHSTKDELLKAAMELFGEYGYDGTSVRAIAAKVGCNVSMIGFHFGGKEQLYLAVKTQLLKDVHQYLDPITDAIQSVVQGQVGHPNGFRVLRCALTEKLTEVLGTQIQQPLFLLLRKALREGDQASKDLYSEIFIPMLESVESYLDIVSPSTSGRNNHLKAFIFIDTLIGIIRDMPILALVDGQSISDKDAAIFAEALCDILSGTAAVGKK